MADDLLKITAKRAFEAGVRASNDPEVVVDDYAYGRSAFIHHVFRERYGLVKERIPKSEAEAIANLERLLNEPDA